MLDMIFGRSRKQTVDLKPMRAKTKPVVKRTAAKAPTRIFMEATDDMCFWVNNGPVLKNLHDLANALETMSDEQYDYHTLRDGNDFARWTEGVLGDKDLAKKIARAKNCSAAAAVLQKYLA
ncbi:MAG: hypothetical protein P4L62_01325 [Candidatus Pacebacteria bacterium]|nr:hypothetical protein [Candidatus Paceibacterota bacterium]MDR3582984.1 hypothetical protein [Candidatus Paceibacterota bacterium]